MCPAAHHELAVKTLKAIIYLIAVALYSSPEVAQENHCRLFRAGSSVIVEEDLSVVRIANNPQITLHCSSLLIIYHREGTLVNLDIIGGQDPSSQMVIEWSEQLAALGEPVSHSGRAYPNPKIAKTGYLPVKREVIKIFLDDYLCQKSSICHAFVDGTIGKWRYHY